MFTLKIFIASFCAFATVHSHECNFPPALWCSSQEIAAKCQVENQCMYSAWKNTQVAIPVNITLYYESLCPGCKEFIKEQLYPVWTELKNIMNAEFVPYGNANVERQCMLYNWKLPTAPPVNFTVYIESLCPDCKDFIKKELWPVWNQVKGIMNLELVPYGNAEEHFDTSSQRWMFQCQHGIEECKGNLIETCAIHILKKIDVYMPFIHCIEISEDMPEMSAPQCAEKLGIHYEPIKNCSTTEMGNKLEHEMAVVTNNLNPPHKYVPWVTLNGVHTEEIQQKAQMNLLELVCDTYQGQKPKECMKILQRCPRT